MSDDDNEPLPRKRPDATAAMTIPFEGDPGLPFIRPNPLLQSGERRRIPTPPSLEGLPFTAPDPAAANDRGSMEEVLPRGDVVPIVVDGPFVAATMVSSLRPPRLELVLVIKASFRLARAGEAASPSLLDEPAPLSGDEYDDDDPLRERLVATDFAPIKSACDILVSAPAEAERVDLRVSGRGGTVQRLGARPREVGPISPSHPDHARLAGTYDMDWYATRWPHYAEDLDIRYFQSAGARQRLAQAFGDERYEIHTDPRHGLSFEGALPAFVPIVAVRLTGDRGLRRVPLRLDTITFALAEERGDLVFRGRWEVSDDDAPEVEQILVMPSRVGEEITVEELRVRSARASQGEERARPGAPRALSSSSGDDDDDDDDGDDGGEDDGAALADDEDTVDGRTEDPGAGARALLDKLRDAGASDEERADVAHALSGGDDDDEAQEVPAPPEAKAVDVRAEVSRRIDDHESLAGMSCANADLSGLDFTGQDLTECDLTGACLRDAVLVRAKLDRGEATGACFDGADLRDVSAVAASFFGASFRRARLDRALLTESDLSETDLEGAVLDHAKLEDVKLYGARASRASFRSADFTNGRAEGAVLSEASFTQAVVDGAVLERATLVRARFDGASLVGASLVRARAQGASFPGANMTEARAHRADLRDCSLVRVNLLDATLDRADLTGADLRGACLHGASALETRLARAHLQGAIVTATRIGGGT